MSANRYFFFTVGVAGVAVPVEGFDGVTATNGFCGLFCDPRTWLGGIVRLTPDIADPALELLFFGVLI